MKILIAILYAFQTFAAQAQTNVLYGEIQPLHIETSMKLAGKSGTLKQFLKRLRGRIGESDHKYLKTQFASTLKTKYTTSKIGPTQWKIATSGKSITLSLKKGTLFINKTPIPKQAVTDIKSVHRFVQKILSQRNASTLESLFINEADGFWAAFGMVVAAIAVVLALPAMLSGLKTTFKHGQFLRKADNKKAVDECRGIQEKMKNEDMTYPEAKALTYGFAEKMQIGKKSRGEFNFLVPNSLPPHASQVNQCIHEFKWARQRIIARQYETGNYVEMCKSDVEKIKADVDPSTLGVDNGFEYIGDFWAYPTTKWQSRYDSCALSTYGDNPKARAMCQCAEQFRDEARAYRARKYEREKTIENDAVK